MALVANPTEQKYQQAVEYYTQTGLLHSLKRQWNFLKESDQKDLMVRGISTTVGSIFLCTWAGVNLGNSFAETLSLKGQRKTVFIIGGGSGGFMVGMGLSIIGQAWAIEHSARLGKWNEVNINQIVEKLLLEEFELDSIWSQFKCPIKQGPLFIPIRIPSGGVFELDELMKCADANGMIKDVYNKRIGDPDALNPDETVPIVFHIDACMRDIEMMLVIYKRFRHLATVKSNEAGISISTRQFFLDYKNSLGELVKPRYIELQEKITKKKLDAQLRAGVTDEEVIHAELEFIREIATFKELFGNSPVEDINWNIPRDWQETLNKRWMATYHS